MIDVPENIRLIIFDVDGTIADRDSDQLYEDAAHYFSYGEQQHYWALATNQGGVGLRLWMEAEGFGEPENYPTEKDITRRLYALTEQIAPDGDDGREVTWYVCYAYQSKKSGKWAPVGDKSLCEWQHEFRKPAPGMLIQAMGEYECQGLDTLMVGDGEEDLHAAEAAGVHFLTADTFFGRVK